ncbi:hypothetical protein D1007_19932 [Hordeum vulgare]|nr:hypothetical protein D1007_19932 [Hordeum vulgare]
MRKPHDGEQRITGRQIGDTEKETLRRIRERLQVMRENLRNGLGGIKQPLKPPENTCSSAKDPPDKGGEPQEQARHGEDGETPRVGDGSSTTRVLLQGDSSRSHEGRVSLRRLGTGGDIIAPKFPIDLGMKKGDFVELDLTKERAAMKTRWIVVGLYFLHLPYNNEGLFGCLKNKWGLRGHLDYKPLKNNRFLLEFEQEGDRRFILDNGPWRYKGDAFLMVANERGTPRVMWRSPTCPFSAIKVSDGGSTSQVMPPDVTKAGKEHGNGERDNMLPDPADNQAEIESVGDVTLAVNFQKTAEVVYRPLGGEEDMPFP